MNDRIPDSQSNPSECTGASISLILGTFFLLVFNVTMGSLKIVLSFLISSSTITNIIDVDSRRCINSIRFQKRTIVVIVLDSPYSWLLSVLYLFLCVM